MNRLLLLLFSFSCLTGLCQDTTEVVFNIQRREDTTTRLPMLFCYTQYSPSLMIKGGIRGEKQLIIMFSADTMVLFIPRSKPPTGDTVKYVGKHSILANYEEAGRMALQLKDSIAYTILVGNDIKPAEKEFFSLLKRKTNGAPNFLHFLDLDCPTLVNTQYKGEDSVEVLKTKFRCYKVEAEGWTTTKPSKKNVVKTVYYLDQKTFLPIRITVNCTESGNWINYSWELAEIIQ